MINVRDHGAIGDGITDDTAAFVSALAVGSIMIPAGVYLLAPIALSRAHHGRAVVGEGKASRLLLRPGSAAPLLGAVNARCLTIRDLWIDGNRSQQTSNDASAISLAAPDYDPAVDPVREASHVIDRVLITNCAGDAVNLSGHGGVRLSNVEAWYIGQRGIILPQDSYATACDVGSVGLSGFEVGASATLSACKVWWTGMGSPVDGDGFRVVGGNATLAGCIAQDCAAAGFAVSSSYNALEAIVADTCGQYTDDGAGVELHSGAAYNRISGVTLERTPAPRHETWHAQPWGLHIRDAGSVRNTISLIGSGFRDGAVKVPGGPSGLNVITWAAGSQINTQIGATNYTPNPYHYETHHLYLTGSPTIVAPDGHAGQRLRLILQQSSAVQSVAWSGAWRFAGGQPPSLADGAYRKDIIEFIREGTTAIPVWLEVGRALNIPA